MHLTPTAPGDPSGDEWSALAPFVARHARDPGCPLREPRARLDAIFRGVATGARWADAPPEYGRPDTVARQFRRWARDGLFDRLLLALADRSWTRAATLRRIEFWICRACRRVYRVAGLSLPRRLGFLSALTKPACLLPDPLLSEAGPKIHAGGPGPGCCCGMAGLRLRPWAGA